MKCLHCQTEFFPDLKSAYAVFDKTPQITLKNGQRRDFSAFIHGCTCPACRGGHLTLQIAPNGFPGFTLQAYPRSGAFSPAPAETPGAIASDYAEANEVLSISPKASAALARRCLQALLLAAGYQSKNLIEQIDAAINENDASKALPSAIRDSMDAIRNFGNFSAHPLTDKTTLQVIDVDPGEAEWCLELLLDLFDHYYVRPAKSAERKLALGKKLSAAGKPPMKELNP